MNRATRHLWHLILVSVACGLLAGAAAAGSGLAPHGSALMSAQHCCSSGAAGNCCGGACCSTLPNPGQPERTPLQRPGERNRGDSEAIAPLAILTATNNAATVLALAIEPVNSFGQSLIAQHVRLQI